MNPDTGCGHHRHIHAADAADAAAHNRGQILVHIHVDAARIGRCRAFADGSEVQSPARLAQEQMHHDRDDHRQIDEPVVGEKQSSEHRDLRERTEIELGKRLFGGARHGDETAGSFAEQFAEKVTEACAEDREREARHILIGS